MHPFDPCGPALTPYMGGVHGRFLHWIQGDPGVIFGFGFATWAVDDEGAAVRKIVDVYLGAGDYSGIGQYGYYADVSPDGSRIVYSTCEYTYYDHDNIGRTHNLGYELAAVNADGSERRRLTNNVHFENYPAWSPDGTRVAFIAHNAYRFMEDYAYGWPRSEHYDTYNSEIFTRGADGTDERVVPDTKGVGLYPPVWSPEGDRLAFTAHEDQRARYWESGALERFLYTVRLDGSELSRIGEATTLPTWSPDGERVAFGLYDGVYTVRFDGTDLQELLDDFRANDVSWSSDGTELLLASGGGVHVVRPDGSGLRRLGPPIRTTAATWSPDGSMIAAARHETDIFSRPWTSLVFIMDRDGADVRFLAQGSIEDDALKGPIGKIRSLASAPIDPATCSNDVVVPDPDVKPGLVHDCRVLIGLRSAFGALATSGWKTDTPMAKWTGVVVGGDPPRVRELRLRYNVTGTIPPDIANLTMLEVLSIYGNNLMVGPIPPELGNLTKLRVLGLRDGNLSGPIPPELGNLSMLMWLFLENNNLSGTIPPELGKLTMLEGLDLTHNELSGCVPVELPDLWVEASGLERCKP